MTARIPFAGVASSRPGSLFGSVLSSSSLRSGNELGSAIDTPAPQGSKRTARTAAETSGVTCRSNSTPYFCDFLPSASTLLPKALHARDLVGSAVRTASATISLYDRSAINVNVRPRELTFPARHPSCPGSPPPCRLPEHPTCRRTLQPSGPRSHPRKGLTAVSGASRVRHPSSPASAGGLYGLSRSLWLLMSTTFASHTPSAARHALSIVSGILTSSFRRVSVVSASSVFASFHLSNRLRAVRCPSASAWA